jgi:hypothetical protein
MVYTMLRGVCVIHPGSSELGNTPVPVPVVSHGAVPFPVFIMEVVLESPPKERLGIDSSTYVMYM